MGWLKVVRETPRWMIVIAFAVFILVFYLGIVRNHFEFTTENLNEPSDNKYPAIRDKLSPFIPAMEYTNIIYAAGVIICVILGLICLLLGIARSINKLDGKTSYLMAAFLVLFAINTFTAIDALTIYMKPAAIFHIRWVSYFIYPFPFFLYIFVNLRPSFYKWSWLLFFLPVLNSIAVWIAHLTVGMPFEKAGELHTVLAVNCFIILLTLSFFGAVQKRSIWYTRVISLIWLIWLGSVLIRIPMERQYRMHDEVIVTIIICAIVTVCYLLFTGSKELFTYQTHIKTLETRNNLLLENYQNIEAYSRQNALMKHEMHNHLLAIKLLLDEKQNERLAQYLADIQDTYLTPAEPVFCGHHLIQSMLGHTRQKAQQLAITTDIEVAPLPPMSLSDADAVSLLMNLLNNAIECCEKINPPDIRWIRIHIKCKEPYLYISVENALDPGTKPRNGSFATTKKDASFHGYGVSIVRDVAKKYNGFATFEYNEDSFTAEAALNVIGKMEMPV